jgi:hypothetical protein
MLIVMSLSISPIARLSLGTLLQESKRCEQTHSPPISVDTTIGLVGKTAEKCVSTFTIFV